MEAGAFEFGPLAQYSGHARERLGRPSRRRFLRYAFGLSATLLAATATLARAEPLDYRWVATKRAAPLRLSEAGADVRWLPRGILLRVAEGASGPRLHAWCPAFASFGSIEASAVEDAAVPTEDELAAQRSVPVLPSVIVSGELPGRVVGAAHLRLWPEVRRDTLLRQVSHNAPLRVVETVYGEDGDPWYRLSDEAGGPGLPRGASVFVHSNDVRLPRTDFHPLTPNPDRSPRQWFEADLQQPAILTAYDGDRAVWSSLVIHGKVPDVTPVGSHHVIYRVARETMTSERVYPPIPRGAPGGYYLENVLYTQYFNRTGAAIHYNYWVSNWGYRASRGCLGLPLAESRWCWDWADMGTPVVVFA
jgi:lipoprotein-anchoring transpeptidase ErfK/SrfK